MLKKILLYVTIGVVVIGAIFGGLAWRRRQARQAMQEEIRTATVERKDMLVAVSASGNIEPESRINLSFGTPGRVEEVLVDTGDTVEAGDTLAQLDTTDLEFAVRQAEINYQSALTRLERLQNPPDEKDIEAAQAAVREAAAAYDIAQRNLTLTKQSVSVGDAVRAARRAKDQAYTRYEDLQSRYDNDEPGITDSMVDAAHDAYLDALGAYNRAVENAELQVASAENEVTRAYNALQNARNNLESLQEGASEKDIEAAELDVEGAELALERAENDLSKAVLTAPFEGTVASVNVKEGELASTGVPAITMIDRSTFRLHISVDEIDVSKLELGQDVSVAIDALSNTEIHGEVERIAPAAGSLEGGIVYYPVTVKLDETDEPIRADMTATATITVEELNDVLAIPTWIVRVDRTTGQTYVQKRGEGGNFERVNVELGVRYEGFVEVLSGLSEGEELVWIPDEGPFGLTE